MAGFVCTASIYVEGREVRSTGEATDLVYTANEQLAKYFVDHPLLPHQHVEIRLPDEVSWERFTD